MKITEYIKNNILYLDGGMGTILQEKGLKPGEYPETWNISRPDIIQNIHKAYFDAGSNVINTNTFGANIIKFQEDELEIIIKSAIENAKKAASESIGNQEKFIALDIGPSGRLLKPYGDFDFEDAVSLFAKTIRLGVKYGVDLIFIETMNDSYETKAALLAAKENSDLPVFVSNAYSENGKLMTGAEPEAMVALLEGMRADAIGVNCSLGPKQIKGIIEKLLKTSSLPIILKPNAGLPKTNNGKTYFDVSPEEFSEDVAQMIQSGVRIAGGCCGTTPEYIKKVVEKTKNTQPVPIKEKNITMVSSYNHAVIFDKSPILIGERINPTGKKRFKQALLENDIDYILQEGINQQEKGVHILDVNVGLPEIDEVNMLTTAVCELQSIINLPLQIDTSNVTAMEAALRRYNGKAMINSVNGKQESMDLIFPLVKKYGGLVVALTLDENGIPTNSEDRINIANKIINTASKYGISKKDIIFDTLAMTVSAEPTAALTTLEALNTIKYKLGCHTSLGISNVSFGLPYRDAINSEFFAAALEKGLSSAIMNPYSGDMLKTYYAYKALHGLDENCSEYINFITSYTEETVTVSNIPKQNTSENTKSALQNAIIKGLKDQAGELTKELLKTSEAIDIVQKEVIPALDIVGKGYEQNKIYLPQLLISAEAAKNAFENIKSALSSQKNEMNAKCDFVIATVQGDIHDIGKNIVKLLLENYGFKVTDLGRDVSPETIVKKVVELHAPLAGLSALMTTTVPAMEKTVMLLKKSAPWCKTVVGGAVLTQDYANSIGADKYAKDAMDTVRYAEEVNNTIN